MLPVLARQVLLQSCILLALLVLLLVERLDDASKPTGEELVAVDRAQAGEGDVVLVMQEGNGVRQLFGIDVFPVRSVIVGIVDSVYIDA